MTAQKTGPALAIEPERFRRVLGQFPTGVCVIAANGPEGPSGMVVGSFASVSLDPPLVAFYVAKTSTSWPKIESAGAFCVNILGADQEDVCRTFSSKAPDKFAEIQFQDAPRTGSPVIDGVVAWIDCDIDLVQDAGDHILVMGRVHALDVEDPRLPLLFFQGGYGRFAPLSLRAPDANGSLTTPLRYVDLVRPYMERVSEEHSCRCLAGALVNDEVILLASAGHSQDGVDTTTLVGQRLPYLPPSGSVFAAWAPKDEQELWLRTATEPMRDQHREALGTVRQRGCSLGLLSSAQREFASTLEEMAHKPLESSPTALFGLIPKLSYDPPTLTAETLDLVRQISVPVFDTDGNVALALTIFGYGAPADSTQPLIQSLLDTAAAATRRIGGRAPE